MKHHQVKSWQPFFAEVRDGRKSFDVRYNDRGFQAGDLLVLREWDQDAARPTGYVHARRIVYVLAEEHAENFGCRPGFVVLGLGDAVAI